MQVLTLLPAYVSVRLHPSSLNLLVPFYTRKQFKGHNPISVFDIHVTVMSSLTWFEDPSINFRIVRPQDMFEATIKEPKFLGDWVTLELDSPQLIERHEVWKRAGMVHSFDKYLPHLSFGKTQLTPQLAKDLEVFNGLKIQLYRESVVPGRV